MECACPDLINFGILGCANIAKKNALAILRAAAETKKLQLTHVASRDLSKAKEFVEETCQSASNEIITCTYDELVNNPDIHCVYVPLPTALHLNWVSKLAAKGKNILLEKPVGTTYEETLLMLKICKDENVIIMDGTMFMHHPRLKAIQKFLVDPKYCTRDIHVRSLFCFNAGEDFFQNDIRVKSNLDNLGALGDLGHYCVRQWLTCIITDRNDINLNLSQFEILNAYCSAWKDGVPLHVEARVKLGVKYSLSFECSFMMPFQQSVEISLKSNRNDHGDAIIKMDDFVIPKLSTSARFTKITYPSSGPFSEYSSMINGIEEVHDIFTDHLPQETQMIMQICKEIQNGNEGKYWSFIIDSTEYIIHKIMNKLKEPAN